jgi:hypothetical protein
MKQLSIIFLFLFFSFCSKAGQWQEKKAEPTVTDTGKSTDSLSKKPAKPVTKQPVVVPANTNQKNTRKETSEDDTDYHGPLSWGPSLLY